MFNLNKFISDSVTFRPVSMFAADIEANKEKLTEEIKGKELMAHAYSKLYNIPSTGLRFFTVYGPAGRPDMAYFGFTNKLVKGIPSKSSTMVTVSVTSLT